MLAPFLGLAWLMVRWTDLTMIQACIAVFAHLGVVYYLLKVYLRIKGWEFRWWGLVLASFSLALVSLEGYGLHNWTDLTLFQAILVISGPHLITAYLTVDAMLGSVPTFLRDTALGEMWNSFEVGEW